MSYRVIKYRLFSLPMHLDIEFNLSLSNHNVLHNYPPLALITTEKPNEPFPLIIFYNLKSINQMCHTNIIKSNIIYKNYSRSICRSVCPGMWRNARAQTTRHRCIKFDTALVTWWR